MGIASAFVARSAHVILTGRNRDKLAAAVKDLGDAARSISHFRIAAARQIRRATPASPNFSLLISQSFLAVLRGTRRLPTWI